MQMESMATDSSAEHMYCDQPLAICLACLEDFQICNPYNSNGRMLGLSALLCSSTSTLTSELLPIQAVQHLVLPDARMHASPDHRTPVQCAMQVVM